jgi:acyl-CoA reductase-like NAD-dependent aldehyde dehydrogenase
MTLQTINPASAVVASYEETSPEAMQAVIARAHQAHLAWRCTSFRERAALMRRAADVLRGMVASMPVSWPKRWVSLSATGSLKFKSASGCD